MSGTGADAGLQMSMADRGGEQPALAGAPEFAELSDREYALFASIARTRRTYAGEALFQRGDLGTTMYVIVEGAVELDFGDDIDIKTLGAREFFGELGLLVGDHARSAGARVTVAGELLELRHEEFQRLVAIDPTVVCYFLRRAITRVVLNEKALIRRLRRRNQDLETALDTLRATSNQLSQTEALVRRDELTGLYNRRGLLQHLEERRRNGATRSLALLLVDCDSFKQINDTLGHLAGDRVLQGVASILRSVVPAGELACRVGGDEFCLLVPADSREQAMRYAEFVLAMAQRLLQLPQMPPLICPLSIGACLVAAEDEGEWADWYACADLALYRAKRLGGNRVEWQDSALPA